MNDYAPTQDQTEAISYLLSQNHSTPELSASDRDETVTLAELAEQTNLTVEKLYSRAKHRKLLIDAPYRSPAAARRVYKSQIDLVLNPGRSSRSEGTPSPVQAVEGNPAPQQVQGDMPGGLATIRKLVNLTHEGHLTQDEAFTLIAAVLR